MDCDTLTRYLDLYLDGELAVEERAEVESHLRGCTPCRDAAGAEARFRTAMQQTLLAVRAPRSLHEQVARRIRDRRALAEPQPRVFVLAYAASLLMVVGAAYGGWVAVTRTADPADDAIAAHAALDGSEVFGDSKRVGEFLKVRAPFGFRVPIAERDGVRLVGARVTRLGSVPAIVYLYDVEGRQVSVAQYPTAEGAAGNLKLDHRDGYMVATWRDGDLTHTVVGDVPDREVSRVIPAAWAPAP